MSNETTVTVRGWAGSDAKLFIGENSAPATAKVSAALVNVGVTPRIFDRKTQSFRDGETMWYSVRCYGSLAANVSLCVKRGHPLLVRGRLARHTYRDKSGNMRTSQVIFADSVGVELSHGKAEYVKTVSAPAGTAVKDRDVSESGVSDAQWETGCTADKPGEPVGADS